MYSFLYIEAFHIGPAGSLTYIPEILPPVTQLHFIPVDLGSPIVHCSVADPYVVIMTTEGVVTMFVLKTDTYMGKTHRLALQKPQISSVSEPSAGFHFD